jgi:hypothetical protein
VGKVRGSGFDHIIDVLTSAYAFLLMKMWCVLISSPLASWGVLRVKKKQILDGHASFARPVYTTFDTM